MAMNSFSYQKSEQVRTMETHTPGETPGLDSILDEKEVSTLRRAQQVIIDVNSLRARYTKAPGLGRRVAPRFALSLTTVVLGLTSSFRTESVNISESGMLLKDLIPVEIMGPKLEIVIIFTDPDSGATSHLLFQAEAIGEPTRSARVMFRKSNKNSQETLQKILERFTPMAA